tara:strand:+ start:315 stop:947 length:633 start_codon:yes stop_codon:yes gene_type:complete
MAALGSAPVGVVLQQFDIKAIQPARGLDVKGALADLFDSRDAREGQEEAKMIGELLKGTGDGFAADQVLGLELLTIGSEDELGFELGGGRAIFECREGVGDRAKGAGGDMDVVALQDPAKIGFVRFALAQLLDLGGFAPEGFEKGKGEFSRVEGGLSKLRDGLFDLNRVHLHLLSRRHLNDEGARIRSDTGPLSVFPRVVGWLGRVIGWR